MDNIQHKIISIYAKHFAKLTKNLGFSAPLMPNISPRYLDNRVVIMGQETNTWYNDVVSFPDFKKSDKEIERSCLTERIDKFVKEHVEKYGGKFWQFNRTLYSENILEGNIVEDDKLSHCWLNLFCVEKCQGKKDKAGRPSQNRALAKKVMEFQQKLLYEVFEIIKPKVIVALIGLNNDDYLIKNALNAQNSYSIIPISKDIDKPESLSEFKITDTANCLYNTTIIRAYHPTYFMGYMPKAQKPKYLTALIDKIKSSL